MDGSSFLDVLHRRDRVLSLLVDGPLAKRDVVDELDVSRSTVDRAVRDLEANGLLERTDDGYVATVAGRVSETVHDRYRRAIADVESAASLLALLDADVDVDERVVTGATTMQTTAPDQYAPLERLKELVVASDRHYGMSAADSGTGFGVLFHEQVVEHGLDLEFVFTEAMVDNLRERIGDELREMDAHGFDAYAVQDLPFGVAICEHGDDATTALLVYDDRSRLAGVLFNDTPEAVAWARETYERYRSSATRVRP